MTVHDAIQRMTGIPYFALLDKESVLDSDPPLRHVAVRVSGVALIQSWYYPVNRAWAH